MSGLLGHLLPPFDAWWPNVIGSLAWVPFVAAGHYLNHRLLKRNEVLMMRLHRHHDISEDA